MAFGRLPSSVQSQPISEINVTPLVDVMLVLLVIFLLTAPLLTSSIRLDLPRAQGTAAQEGAPAVVVFMQAQGTLYLGEQALSQAQLAERLRQIGRDAPQTEVQLRADALVPYGRVVEVIGAAQLAGLQRIGFVTVPAP